MKALKLNCIILLVLALIFSSASVFAQQDDNKEVKKEIVIIKETVDEDGNVQVKKIIRSADSEDIIIENNVGEEIEVYEIDGAEKVHIIELEDMEGLSEEMKETLKNIDVDIDEDGDNRRIRIIMESDEEGSEPAIIEWEGNGEIPEDIKRKMHESGVVIGDATGDGHAKGFAFMTPEQNGNKACLGVMIGKTVENKNGVETVKGESEKGVTILDIIDASGAQEAGLQKDDVITAINGSAVATIHDVLDILKPFEGGATVSIDYLRNNQPAQVNATLKTCENKMKVMHFEDHEGHNFEMNEDMNWVEEDKVEGEHQSKRVIVIKKNTNKEVEEAVTVPAEDNNVSEIETPDDVIFNSTENPDQTLELQDFSMFPNPTAGNLTVEFKSEPVATIVSVLDITGKEIYREELTNFDGTYKKEINLGDVPKGTLMLTVRQNDKVFAEKIVAQ